MLKNFWNDVDPLSLADLKMILLSYCMQIKCFFFEPALHFMFPILSKVNFSVLFSVVFMSLNTFESFVFKSVLRMSIIFIESAGLAFSGSKGTIAQTQR